MSAFMDFVNSLRPDWDRESMEDDLNLIVTEISNVTIPMCEKFSRVLVGELKSVDGRSMTEQYRDVVRTKQPMVAHITQVLTNAMDCLLKLLDLNRKVFTEATVTSAAMSFKKATIVRYIETVQFASDYTRMLVHYLSVCETTVADNNVKIDSTFTKADIDYIKSRFVSFCEVCERINVKREDFAKKIDKIPNTPINPQNESVLRNIRGDKEVDPLSLGFLPIYINPFYHIAMGLANYQANRYRNATNELRALELRLANLEKLSQGTNDTQLQSEIKSTERLISDARYEIAKMNKKYGLNAESASPMLIKDMVMAIGVNRILHVKDILNA